MKLNKITQIKIVKKYFSEKKACYYRILGLQIDASKKDIKKKFIQLAKEYHPDINTDKTSQKIFKEVSEAYGILSNNELKREYDEKIQEKKTTNERKNKFEEENFSKNMNEEDFEKINEEIRKENWERKKNEKDFKLTKDYLDKKYFKNNYETKDPLNSWNFNIDLEKKKNDKEKVFYETHTRFRGGDTHEYWEKDEDLKKDYNNNKYVFLEVLKENDPLYNASIAMSLTIAGIYYFYPGFF